jgi:hypothetical protein
MSFDIFLQCYRKEKPATFRREIFEGLFLQYCPCKKSYASDPKFMQVEYPDGGGADIYLGNLHDDKALLLELGKNEEANALPGDLGDPRDIAHMMFNHCGGDMFFDAMYKLADQTKSVIFWPNSPSLVVVTDEAVLKELPADFPGVENPRVVRSGAEIIAAIESS